MTKRREVLWSVHTTKGCSAPSNVIVALPGREAPGEGATGVQPPVCTKAPGQYCPDPSVCTMDPVFHLNKERWAHRTKVPGDPHLWWTVRCVRSSLFWCNWCNMGSSSTVDLVMMRVTIDWRIEGILKVLVGSLHQSLQSFLIPDDIQGHGPTLYWIIHQDPWCSPSVSAPLGWSKRLKALDSLNRSDQRGSSV